ncbi:Trihelix transcription factor ASIL1, partial [Mucuna pruriens]
MDGIEDDARYPSNPYGIISHRRGYGYQNSPYSLPVDDEYAQHDNDENEEQEQLEGDDEVDVDQSDSLQLPQKGANEEDGMDGGGGENYDNHDDDDDDDDEEEEEEEEEEIKQISYYATKSEDDLEWHPKKQKLKSLISTYELAPRVPAPAAAAAAPSVPKPSFGGRNSLTDWTEQETFVLLDAWGDRFLQHGRKSLRCEEWQQVAKMVSQVSKIERTDTQCRNRLDTLKKKYKKEKAKFPDSDGKWVYFKRMDELMSSPPQQAGFSCGLDSGEYVFMNPQSYLNRANGLDEMRDSPENTESTGEEGSDGPQAKKRRKGRGSGEASSFRLLADSIQKFSKIYEKIENSKRQQMVELEKMRMDFHKELETQKRQILENLQCEISKLEHRNDENDDSAENDHSCMILFFTEVLTTLLKLITSEVFSWIPLIDIHVWLFLDLTLKKFGSFPSKALMQFKGSDYYALRESLKKIDSFIESPTFSKMLNHYSIHTGTRTSTVLFQFLEQLICNLIAFCYSKGIDQAAVGGGTRWKAFFIHLLKKQQSLLNLICFAETINEN